MFKIRTDLALEARQMYKENAHRTDEAPGTDVSVVNEEDAVITHVKIMNKAGEEAIGKPIGDYITLEVNFNENTAPKISQFFSRELSKLIPSSGTALVVGLGNSNITPDSLGPRVISKLFVSKHLTEYVPEYFSNDIRPVCAIAPGVLGTTGIETGEIIKGITENVKPDFIIAIDALASRSMDRINSTIQIANTGINPGSGIGNKRKALSMETLGVPVIAVGIPTVVDAATLAADSLDIMINTLTQNHSSDFLDKLKNLESKHSLFEEILNENMCNMLVTPKEIDSMITTSSELIADGINITLNPRIEF